MRGDLTSLGPVARPRTYKWAHSIDNIEDRGAGQGDFQTEINGRTDNRFDPDYLRGPTTNMPTHRFVFSAIWMLPVGRGRKFGADMPAALDASPAAGRSRRWCSCSPAPHLSAFYSSHCGSGTNCYGSEKADGGGRTGSERRSADAGAVVQHRRVLDGGVPRRAGRAIFAGRFGNADKGNIIGPGAWNVDFAAFKDVRARRARDRPVQRVRHQPVQSSELGPAGDERDERQLRTDHVAVADLPAPHVVLGGRITY